MSLAWLTSQFGSLGNGGLRRLNSGRNLGSVANLYGQYNVSPGRKSGVESCRYDRLNMMMQAPYKCAGISSDSTLLGEEGYTSWEPTRKQFVVPRGESVGNVRAYYIAKKIRVVPMFQKMYGRQKNWLEVDSLIVSFPEEKNRQGTRKYWMYETPPPAPDEKPAAIEEPSNKKSALLPYAVFFDYGAVVFFNCDEVLQTESIAQAEQFCEGYLETGGTAGSDDFSVDVDSSIETWSEFKANRLVLQKLDINNIRVISAVLGQSVALGHFEQVVDGMLQSFEKANNEDTVSSNTLTLPAQTKLLFKILRESNTVLSEVIVKLGLLDRTRMRDTAWKYEKYFKIWEGMREEFEIDTRWDIMNTKTEYLQHNMRFFVELLHSQKGERLEWMIIVLISLELLVSLYELFFRH